MNPSQKTAAYLVVLVLSMGALSFAAVPFYDWFCRVTGFGGTPLQAAENETGIIDQTIKVRFDASLAAGMPWTFAPEKREMTVRLGETALAFYRATNPTDAPVAGTASFNVVPDQAGGFFVKIECFCFTEQVLQPGETVLMPVSFYVDPAILENPETAEIPVITLSYTFHETELPSAQAALASPPAQPVN